jgi:hypothetical protein
MEKEIVLSRKYINVNVNNKKSIRAHIVMLKDRKTEAEKEGADLLMLNRFDIKIEFLQNELAIIKQLESRMNILDKYIKEFFGYSVKSSRKRAETFKERSLHKQIFYRCGIENDIAGHNLATFVGFESHGRAHVARESTFKNQDKREVYKRFTEFMKDKKF